MPLDNLDLGRLNSYGPVWSLFLHLTNFTFGIETWGIPSTSAEAFEMRHYTTVVLSFIATISLATALYLATRSSFVAVSTFAFIQALPLWSGYAMFAIKDMPVAAGYTIFTAGIIASFFSRSPTAHIFSFTLISLGIILSVGVRTAMWLPFAITLGLAVIYVAILRPKQFPLKIYGLLGSFLVGVTVVILLARNHSLDPIDYLFSSVRYSANFEAWSGTTLTAGSLLPANPGLTYLPLWVGSSVPIGIGILAFAGLAGTFTRVLQAAYQLVPRKRSGPSSGKLISGEDFLVPGAFLLTQLFGLPLAAVVFDSVIYAGLRQHIYVMPAIGGLAALGLVTLWKIRIQNFTLVPATIAILALIFPAIHAASLFPYQFVYKNALASPINDRWETDMHWISAREAIRSVPSDSATYCYTSSLVNLDSEIKVPKISKCKAGQVRPFLHEKGSDYFPSQLTSLNKMWTIARKYNGSPPAVGCDPLGNITRKLRGEDIVISYVLLCDSDRYISRD